MLLLSFTGPTLALIKRSRWWEGVSPVLDRTLKQLKFGDRTVGILEDGVLVTKEGRYFSHIQSPLGSLAKRRGKPYIIS